VSTGIANQHWQVLPTLPAGQDATAAARLRNHYGPRAVLADEQFEHRLAAARQPSTHHLFLELLLQLVLGGLTRSTDLLRGRGTGRNKCRSDQANGHERSVKRLHGCDFRLLVGAQGSTSDPNSNPVGFPLIEIYRCHALIDAVGLAEW